MDCLQLQIGPALFRCSRCGWEHDRLARKRCHGPPPPCPAIGQPCDRLALNRLNFYCRDDLAKIEGPCSSSKRAKAVVMLADRLVGRVGRCKMQHPAAIT